MVVATWNVRFFSQSNGGLRSDPALIRRAAWALAALPEPPSVLALQEVEGPSLRTGGEGVIDRFVSALDAAMAAHDRPGRFTASWVEAHRLGPWLRTGLAVLCAEPLALTGPPAVIELRGGRGPIQRRLALDASIEGDQGRLRVVAAHVGLPALRHGPRFDRRMGETANQLAQIDRLLDHLRGEDPVLVLGDFNATPGSEVVRRLIASGLTRASLPRPTARFLDLDLHLDHLFTRGITVVDVTVPSTRRGPFAGLSDHVPILARVGSG
ncbi:MAG: endonuclease/exonuclease/phosphatase family protein [Alphaproteobacteria bacterium]|nr:endonuclease/exonuclease/phosphatase family protein [Alphaproteobacteria bacterium]MCB9695673.1 endonuclease/exonuclease/phosphatase family protein [Alphaproteobacteria bacterium]